MSFWNCVAYSAAATYFGLKGDRTLANLSTLQRNEQLTPAQLDEISNHGLQALMKHAYENVPYYAEAFRSRKLTPSDIRTIDDLTKLPILTKQIIRTQSENLISPEYRGKMARHLTGGSTGEQMVFFLAPEVKQWGRAALLRAWGWQGYRLGDKQMLLWGSSFDFDRFRKTSERLTRLVNRILLLNGHIMSDDICAEYASRIRRFNPKMFLGYANSLFMLAGHMLKHNVTDIRPQYIMSAAETLLPHMRQMIEKAFQCPVYDQYAGRETSMYCSQCEHKNLYHIASDNAVIEIVKDDRPAASGESGKILITDLRNFGMPFIRYQVEDVAIAGNDPCPCGRPFPTFRSVEGRMSNIITLPDGRLLDPIYLLYMLYRNPYAGWENEKNGMQQYQIVQETPSEFTVNIVREPGTDYDLSYIIENFRKHIGPDVKVQLNFPHDIPASPRSGKRQYVISKVPLNI